MIVFVSQVQSFPNTSWGFILCLLQFFLLLLYGKMEGKRGYLFYMHTFLADSHWHKWIGDQVVQSFCICSGRINVTAIL